MHHPDHLERTNPEPGLQIAFGPIVVEYERAVIAPRAWTLEQSVWAADLAATVPAGPILELYCGAGHIGLAAAHLCGRTLVQIDDNPAACEWARLNAKRLELVSDVRCEGVESALRIDERFPLVIADPPYLPSHQVMRFPEDPTHAIDGGHDGLVEVRRGLEVIADHLAPGGAVLLQVRGERQRDAVAELLAEIASPLTVTDTRSLNPERAIVLLTPVLVDAPPASDSPETAPG